MPVTYSFTTSLTLPTSDDWPCAFFTESNMPNITLLSEVAVSRGAPWIQSDANNDQVIYSDDGVLSSLVLEIPLSSSFTVQAEFKPSELPDNLADLNSSRFFVGAYSKQNGGGGVLLCKQGLAVVDAPGASAVVLPGSFGILPESDDYYTLRLVVDGDTGLLHVYINKTSELSSTGHTLRYSAGVSPAPTGIPDSVRIEIVGQAGKTVTGKLSALYADCTTAKVPNKRPIADAGADQTTNIGSAITYDGSQSYDPEGEQLTYFWRLRGAPDGSRFKSEGNGSTSSDGGGDGFTTIFDGGSGAFSAENMPLLQPGDHLYVDSVYYQVATTRWVLGSDGKYTRDTAGAWVDNEVVVTEDTLPDSLSGVYFAIYHSNTYFSDQTLPTPYAIPDETGLYEVDLVVNDGELDSNASENILNVSQTSVALGCTPDVSFIWDYLSDFWNQLEDREVVETAWGGFAQACAAQLLTLWQYDYNKSLKDIQRVFQRRWLNYSTLLEETAPSDVSVRIVRAPLYSTDITGGLVLQDLTLQVVFDGGDIETVTFSAGGTLTPQEIADAINEGLGYGNAQTKLVTVVTEGAGTYLKFSYSSLLRIRPGGTANTDLGFSTTEYTQNSLSGVDGETWTTDLEATTTLAFQANDTPTIDFEVEGITNSDLLVIGGQGRRVVKVALENDNPPVDKRGLTTADAMELYAGNEAWEIPSVVVSSSLNFSDALVDAGDIARFELKAAGELPVEVQCTVIGVAQDRLGFDAAPLLAAYNGSPDAYSTKFLGVQRVNNIPVDELVVQVPRLQEVIACPPSYLTENIDYTIGELNGQNAIQFADDLFSITDPPPEEFWAETTYLDNRPTIEDNFGRLVNFKVEDLDTRTDDLDYLSAVRGLWWSYFGGPALSKVRTGVQILLGLPFAEETGTIVEIEPAFSASEGRIVVQDTANETITRAYYYPLDAGLGTNPDTGALYAEGDTVSQFAPLTGGIEVSDYIADPLWLKRFADQPSLGQVELDKFFKFLVRGDVDTFNLTNLVFAIDFVKKVKPHYTFPIFALMKNLTANEVDVTDSLDIVAQVNLFDSSCPNVYGSYRWDDTDESGDPNHAYDDVGNPFYDAQRLCPSEDLWVVMGETLGAGPWYFDSIWAFDDGDTDGVGGSDDRVPLSGPSPTPYGTPVGTITYDASITAGKYWRSKTL